MPKKFYKNINKNNYKKISTKKKKLCATEVGFLTLGAQIIAFKIEPKTCRLKNKCVTITPSDLKILLNFQIVTKTVPFCKIYESIFILLLLIQTCTNWYTVQS